MTAASRWLEMCVSNCQRFAACECIGYVTHFGFLSNSRFQSNVMTIMNYKKAPADRCRYVPCTHGISHDRKCINFYICQIVFQGCVTNNWILHRTSGISGSYCDRNWTQTSTKYILYVCVWNRGEKNVNYIDFFTVCYAYDDDDACVSNI